MRKFFHVCIFLMTNIQVYAIPIVFQDEGNSDTVNLLPFLEYMYSSNRDTVYADLELSNPPLMPFIPTSYIDKKHHYFRFSISNRDQKQKDLIIQLPKMDYARLQIYMNGKLWNVLKTGDLVPFIDKSIPHNTDGYEEFRIKIDPGSYSFVLMTTDRRKVIPLQSAFLLSFNTWKNSLHDNFSYREVGQGVFHGILGMMILFSVYYFLVTKEKSALRFAVSTASMSIYLLVVYGFIPPVLPSVNPKVMIGFNYLMLLLALYTFISFLIYFTNSDQKFPAISKMVTRSKWIILVLYVVSLFFLFNENIISHYYLSRFISGIYLILIWLWYTIFMLARSTSNRLFITSSLPMLMGSIFTLVLFFYQPEQPSIYIPLQAGYLISLTLFSFVMVERYRSAQSKRITFQSRLIKEIRKNEELQKHQNERLEREVTKRTSEIQAQNEELVQQQEELAAQRDMLENQSRIIEAKNASLQNYNLRLENDVQQRTHQLEEINNELILQNQQLEQFSFILAHNLRSPVARLLGLTNLFTLGEKSDFEEIIKRIAHSANDLNEVLKDLNAILEIKNGEGPVKTATSIKSLLERCLGRYQEQITAFGIAVHLDMQADRILTVKPYLESIILNLISNAIKYRSETEAPLIRFSTRIIDDKVELVVEDNGIGIDLRIHKGKVFGIYQRFHSHIDGKGLGLYLVKVQVDALRGKIKVESELNRGTKFTILLPL